MANHLTTFSGNFYVIPNNIDFNKVFKDLPPDNLAVLLTVCITFAVYALGLIIARRADNRDKMKVNVFCGFDSALKIVRHLVN